MKRRILITCLVALLVMSLNACSFKPGPEKTVEKFCEYMKQYDVEGMSNYTVGETKTLNDVAEEENQFAALLSDYFKENLAKLNYTVGEPQIDGDKATVSVDFTYMDAGPVYKAAIGEMFSQAMALAFSGSELTDADSNAMFKAAFEEQKEKIDPITAQNSVEFHCEKTKDGWRISEVDDNVFNIMTSNFVGAMEEVGATFEDGSDSTGDAGTSDEVRVDKKTGDVVELATIKVTVTGSEECQELVPEYGQADVAQDGTKYVVIHTEIENITNKTFSFSGSDIVLIDNKDRQYNFYDDACLSLDNTFSYRDLAPNIKETGTLVYKVPSDLSNYSIVIAKAGTNEVYYIAVS